MPRILRAAAYTGVAWFLYSLTEATFAVATQILRSGARIFEWQWWLVAMLIVAGAAGGILVGAGTCVFGTFIRRFEAFENPWIMPDLTILLAFLICISRLQPLTNAAYLALGVAGILLTVFLVALFMNPWAERIQFLTPPFLLSLLLLIGPFLSHVLGRRSPMLKAGVILPALAIIIASGGCGIACT